jgi:hypothetical protein
LLQQEAVIGIVYAVSASIGVLALDHAPQAVMSQNLMLSCTAISRRLPAYSDSA